MPFKPGDKVTHASDRTLMGVMTVEDIISKDSEVFVMFAEGGFWRASQLKLAEPLPAMSDIANGPMRVPFTMRPVVVQDRIHNAVLAEREECAKLTDQITETMREILASLVDEESWQWALNEMTDEVNNKFRKMQALPYSIATLIRARQP